MVPSSSVSRLVALATGALVLSVTGPRLEAQLVPVRTVPVASGDQFRLVPSSRMGMGGVRYAVDDSLADGWSNPARPGSATVFMGSPTFYGISANGGAGRSFPVAGLFSGEQWFGGASLALQQVENEPGNVVCCFVDWFGPPPVTTLSERFGRNVFAGGFVGRRLGNGWSAGVGASVARLGAMDGVDLLYAGAERIDQAGDLVNLRAAVEHAGPRDRISAQIVHDRVSMVHDVTWSEWIWDDTLGTGELVRRIEKNEDRTNTWAGQLSWDRRLNAPGWRIAAVAAVNHKSHPKIPNYSIQNIPRDPGTTWAFEAGFGLSRTQGPTTFGVDVALQPIWSDTWQEADSADVADSGGRLSIGDRSIENDFSFTNVVLRTGVAHAVGPAEFQTGLEIRSYGYTLDQANWVEVSRRSQDEAWIEWSPTFGLSVSLPALDLRYGMRITEGTGRPGVAPDFLLESPVAGGDADFLIAPGAPLTLQDARVMTHQLAVVIPVR